MKNLGLIQLLLIFYFLSIITGQRDKLQIVNMENPNFRPEETKNLIFGFNHMTSGASSPCYGLNSSYIDIFNQKWDGYCELTKKGFLQLFKLGKIYQQRFFRLLNFTKPDINQVRAFASQANKTLMSSNAFFYGMFIDKNVPMEEQIIIPVRNFRNYNGSETFPIFYFSERSNCIGWNKIVENNLKKYKYYINDRANSFIKRYRKIFDLLKNEKRMINNTVFEKVKIFCSSYLSNYYDDRCPKIDIFKKLNYSKGVLYNIYYDCVELSEYWHLSIEYGWEARKVPLIVLSDLINDMLYYMDEIIKNPDSPKYVSYIGHDSSMAALQIILQKGFNVSPKMMNYASNQLFLLYKIDENYQFKDKNEDYEVRYFYNDQLSMIIGYNEFKNNLLKLMNTEYDLDYFCRGFQKYDYIVFGLCIGIIILFISITSTCCYLRKETKRKKLYISLNEEKKETIARIKN